MRAGDNHSRSAWRVWVVLVLVIFNGGWMAFDGARALLVGDYVTPTTGQYADQLGPWSSLVEAVGIAPRSTLMKWIFVVYGAGYLLVTVAYLRERRWAWRGVVFSAVLGLWYVPFGTLINLAVIALISLPSLRAP